MRKELAKNYNPGEFEDRLYGEWMEKGYFTPDTDSKKPAFSASKLLKDEVNA